MIRLALRVRREDAELALAELLQLAPSGVEELEVGEALVEYAVYGSPGELPELPDLQAAVGGALVEVSTTQLPDDWSERWKRFHRPILIESPGQGLPVGGLGDTESGRASTTIITTAHPVPSLYVRPPWELPCDLPGVKEIVIDPGQAFGTGAHDTTRMCLELLLALACQEALRGLFMDIGTGSGVLAIAAAHLGFAPVLGLDHELESVQAARENATVNGVTVEVHRFDLRREPLPLTAAGGEGAEAEAGAPVVVANLVRPLLLDLAGSLGNPPGHLIASGLLREEADEVAGAFSERLGLRLRERREGGEWAAVWLSSASSFSCLSHP